jgi:hypothetical protein
MIFEANIAGVPVRQDSDALLPVSRDFLLEYGWRQYVQDGAAVSKTFLSGERKGETKTDDEIAAEKAEGIKERLANIESGEFVRRGPGAPKLSPEDTIRQRLAIEAIEGAGKAAGQKLPNRTGKKADSEWWNARVANYLTKYRDDVEKEVARQMRQRAKVMDLTDILG